MEPVVVFEPTRGRWRVEVRDLREDAWQMVSYHSDLEEAKRVAQEETNIRWFSRQYRVVDTEPNAPDYFTLQYSDNGEDWEDYRSFSKLDKAKETADFMVYRFPEHSYRVIDTRLPLERQEVLIPTPGRWDVWVLNGDNEWRPYRNFSNYSEAQVLISELQHSHDASSGPLLYRIDDNWI